MVLRWPLNRAPLLGSGEREERDEPPRIRSSVVVHGGGRKGLIGILVVGDSWLESVIWRIGTWYYHRGNMEM